MSHFFASYSHLPKILEMLLKFISLLNNCVHKITIKCICAIKMCSCVTVKRNDDDKKVVTECNFWRQFIWSSTAIWHLIHSPFNFYVCEHHPAPHTLYSQKYWAITLRGAATKPLVHGFCAAVYARGGFELWRSLLTIHPWFSISKCHLIMFENVALALENCV